jgi:hypothetical protein
MDKNHNWSKKFIQVLQHWQEELRKTTKIGKKMISASKTNSDLHDLYEDLGKKVYFSLKEKSLDSEDPVFQDFVKKIDELQKELELMEGDVNKIKFSDKDKNEDED